MDNYCFIGHLLKNVPVRTDDVDDLVLPGPDNDLMIFKIRPPVVIHR